MNGIEKDKDDICKDIIDRTGLPPYKIRNIYIYGSRVYGTHTVNSDYDAIVVASSLYLNHEIFDGAYNIHITTPDSFADKLRQHDINCFECIFAPEEAIIQNHIDYKKDVKIDNGQLKKMILSQSTWAWSKAQRRIERGNIIGGTKSLFHSFRILKFGMQILRYGRITNFSEANYIWEEMSGCNDVEWAPYQDKWTPAKRKIVKAFRNFEKDRDFGVFDRTKKVENNY